MLKSGNHTEEVQKIRSVLGGKASSSKGYKWTPEQMANRKSRAGWKHSPEALAKIKAAGKKKRSSHSLEHMAKMRAAKAKKRGKTQPPSE